MSYDVRVVGVGMTPFVKPGASPSYDEMGARAVELALRDAGLDYRHVQQAYAGWVYGDSTAGQAALYKAGLTGIPIFNVNNNCATGSSALFLARQAIAGGAADCVLVVGFEQMAPGAIANIFSDRPSPLGNFLAAADRKFPDSGNAPMALRLFGSAGLEYQQRYDAPTEMFAAVRAKASRHAEHNDKAMLRRPLTVEEILASPPLFLNVTRLQCCPPTCGAASAILCSANFARRMGLDDSVAIAGQALTTDTSSSFGESMMSVVGYDMARAAASAVYEQVGIGPEDIDVVELHDCFTTNEVISYEALGLCAEGGAQQFVADAQNTYGGSVVTNPSGGLLSKGHPLGATGLAQCAELVWQLRGQSGVRQVEGARIGLQHNLGLGGACVVTLYERQ